MDNRQYFNDAQQFLLAMNCRDEVAVCGRGFGKGAVQAGRLLTALQGMEGSSGGFVAPSVKRCLTNILPSMLIHIERWGFKRDVHYIVGKKPWKALHWRSPIFQPSNWENTIAFYNGSVCNIISQDRTGTSNSMSLDYLIMDEAKFLDPARLREETFPANRGNQSYFGKFFMHHGLTITSDMPVTKKGAWFLRYKDDMDIDLVNALWSACCSLRRVKQQMQTSTAERVRLQPELESWREVIDLMRQDCLLYCEFTTLENIDLLGEDFIRRMKRELSPQTFETSILNRKVRIAKDGFYGALDEEVNLYTAPNTAYLDDLEYNFDKLKKEDCRMDSDLQPGMPLIVAFDANSNFNCVCVGQEDEGRLRVLSSFYVKYDRKLGELVDDVCAYYKWHRHKQVVFYFDHTFRGTVTGIHEQELYVIIDRAFKRNGWTVRQKYIGRAMNHVEKNLLINNMLKGRAKHQVLINRDNNEDLIISIEQAEVVGGKKKKSGEKKVETEEDQLQNRTDFSDAFDTLCIGVELFPVFQGRSGAPNYYPHS